LEEGNSSGCNSNLSLDPGKRGDRRERREPAFKWKRVRRTPEEIRGKAEYSPLKRSYIAACKKKKPGIRLGGGGLNSQKRKWTS